MTEQVLASAESMRALIRKKTQLKGRQASGDMLAAVDSLLGPGPYPRDQLIEYLHVLNDHYRCLPKPALTALAQRLNLPMAEVYEVATFYHHFEVIADDDQRDKVTIRVCDGLSCSLAGAQNLLTRLPTLLGEPSARVVPVPCVGRCEQAPVAVVHHNPVGYATPERVADVVASGQLLPRLPDDAGDFDPYLYVEAPVTGGAPSDNASPDSAPPYVGLAAYQAAGGYALLHELSVADAVKKQQAIDVMSAAGLRGLGGAGFPTGRKWGIVRDQPGPRLLAVNIDEGEPGTFKDRTYLERDPHRFIEGMLVAAAVVGVDACYIYLRDEYHGCRAILAHELAQLQANSPVALPHIELRRGAGAYICGEESAMLESIEGKRGEPRMRPPYIAEVGLFGRPTLAHNFETLYWVRDILTRGANWFSGFGLAGRTGLRSFSVSGRVRAPGVKLAPAGISLRALVDDYCGGMADGHALYGYLPGGASGGILPARLADVPLDFDTLQPHGCFIGSAAIIVLGHQDKARDAALNMMRFFAHESCGQCTPCRVGTHKAAQLMAQPSWDGEVLADLAQVMADASICGLGQAAPNPLRCVQTYFPDEVR